MDSSVSINVVILTTDLVTSSRLSAICDQAGVQSQQVATMDAARSLLAADQPDWFVVDLESATCSSEDIATLRGAHGGLLRVIAFGPHVHEQKLENARQAGADLVWTRGQIQRDFASLIRAPSPME